MPWVTFRLEIVQEAACWKWHQDAYIARALVTYVGSGTCAVDDASVRWDEFKATSGEETSDSCVPIKDIKQMNTNAVLLMKGDAWPTYLDRVNPQISQECRRQSNKTLSAKGRPNDSQPPIGSDWEEMELPEEDDEAASDENDDNEEAGDADARGNGVDKRSLKRKASEEDAESNKIQRVAMN